MISNNLPRHPKGLQVLFFTEMWERFSYYGMRALLVLYLVNSLNLSESNALHIYAVYTGLVYLTPIFGGYLADRFLGPQKAIFIGGITMILGHFLMAFPDHLYLAMGLLIIGNGYFKPNISTLLGSLYKKNDIRRDSGFSFFYVGINLGAFLAPITIGLIGETVDWHYGFAIAGVGMTLGLIQFGFGQKHLIKEDFSKKTKLLNLRDWTLITVLSALNIPMILLFLALNNIFIIYFYEILCGLIALTIILKLKKGQRKKYTYDDLKKISYISLLSVFVIFFWIGFEQAGGSLTLYANSNIDRTIFGLLIPASFFQAVNPMIIILLGPFIAKLWLKIDKSNYSISTAKKMGFGLILLGSGFLLLTFASNSNTIIISFWWLIAVYFLHTLGELCLSPIGLSMVTRVSPKKLASLMMGFWFLSSAVANYMAGKLPLILNSLNINLFGFLTLTSFSSGLLLILIAPFIEKLINKR
jgi:POT family proton-dependent oligopeptide transporter